MKEFLLRYSYPISIVIIGLLWLQVLNAMLQLGVQQLIFPDSQDYLLAAKDLFLNHDVNAYRALLMTVITGFPYLFGSADAGIFHWSFIVNVCCWLGTALLIFDMARYFLQKKYAFLTAISSFFIIGNVVMNYHLLTESIYVFWIMTGFFCLFRYYKTNRFCWLSVTLSFFLLSMLIKPGSKFLAVVFVLYFARAIIKNYKQSSAFLMYFSLLLIAIQLVGMRAKFGDYKISYIDGVTYYGYLFARADAYKNNADYIAVKTNRGDFIFKQTPANQKKITFEDLKNQLQCNTVNVFKAYVSNVIDNTKTGSDAILKLKINLENQILKIANASFFRYPNGKTVY